MRLFSLQKPCSATFPKSQSAQGMERDHSDVLYNAFDEKGNLDDKEIRPHGAIWCCGAAAFVCGFFLDAFYNVWGKSNVGGFRTDEDPHAITKAVYALLQTGGLVVMALTNVDIDEYLRDRPKLIGVFSFAWVLSFAIWAISPSFNVRIGAVIVSLPFGYTLIQFKQIAAQQGVLCFSETLMLGLVFFTTFLNAMVYLSSSNTRSLYAAVGQGLSYLTGAALMAGAYYHSRRSGESRTNSLHTGMQVFLLQYGFNWLLWDCFLVNYYNDQPVSTGLWLFGFIHFIAGVGLSAVRGDSVYRFPVGLLLFASGFVVLSVVTYEQNQQNVRSAGWFYLLYALVQTGGLMFMTLADVDPNIYFREHRVFLVMLMAVWTSGAAFLAFQPGSPVDQVQLLQCLPWLYLTIRFQPVTQTYEGFPLFTELFAGALGLQLLGTSLMFFLQTPVAIAQQASTLPLVVMGCLFTFGMLTVIAVAYHYSPRRLQYNATVQFQMVAYAFLLIQGANQLVDCMLTIHYFHATAENNPALTPAGWGFGPVHLAPAIVMFTFRKTIHRKIGSKWLEMRLARESSKDGIRQRVTSDLGWLAAVEMDITEGNDLNDYVEQVSQRLEV
jgi:hypothetical protein